MFSWLTIAATLLLISSSIGFAVAVCVNSAVTSCLGNIQELYLSPPVNESEVETYCRNVNDVCSSTLTECGCTTGLDEHVNCLWFIGFKAALAYACSTQSTRSVFLWNRQCIITNDANKQNDCLKGVNNCVAYDGALRCYYYAMKWVCNSETASLMTNVQLRKYQPTVGNLGCTLHLPSEASGVASVASYRLREVLVVAVMASVAAPKFLLQF